MLDEWLNCQRSWLYLEPIFSSEDINRQLPVESKRYQTMERIWRKVMKNAKENPQVRALLPLFSSILEQSEALSLQLLDLQRCYFQLYIYVMFSMWRSLISPEMTLCGWQGVKVQLITNFLDLAGWLVCVQLLFFFVWVFSANLPDIDWALKNNDLILTCHTS